MNDASAFWVIMISIALILGWVIVQLTGRDDQ